ncbi:MAG: glycosyltransferase [Pseudomonadota bacterium]
MMIPKLYILLPVHNRRGITERFVRCLNTQSFTDYHLVLIDDGSSDGTAEMVLEHIPSATVLRGNGDWWWGGSLQQGIDWLKEQKNIGEDLILIINDDVFIEDDFLENGWKLMQGMDGTMLQATIYSEKSKDILDRGMFFDAKNMTFLPAESSEKINCLTTNGLFMVGKNLIAVGDFYPRLLPHYLSDYEFTIRAHRKGIHLLVSPDIKLWWNQETTGFRAFSKQSFLHFMKEYFSKKSALNPFYWSSFVILACPARYLPRHLFRIWKNALKTIFKHARGIIFKGAQ